MSDREKITPQSIKFPHDVVPPQGSTGRSLINEVEKLQWEVSNMREALLRLVEAVQGLQPTGT